MRIKVNGKPHDLDGPLSVEALTCKLEINVGQVAIERNREIVPRSLYGKIVLAEDDEIEIVRFIGGG